MGKSYIGNIPNTHVRDFQRKRLYQAEESCPFWKPLRFKFLSTKETKTLIKGISNWAEIPIPTLLNNKGKLNMRQSIYATADVISLPFPISRTAPYIAHEMAHVVNYNTSGADHHGPNFTTIYLQVVEKFLGVEAKQELQESFNQNKVRYLI
jgi:hypothetical protein